MRLGNFAVSHLEGHGVVMPRERGSAARHAGQVGTAGRATEGGARRRLGWVSFALGPATPITPPCRLVGPDPAVPVKLELRLEPPDVSEPLPPDFERYSRPPFDLGPPGR
jgi:hypothetical protein